MQDKPYISVQKACQFQSGPSVKEWILTHSVIYIYGLQSDFMQKIKKHSKNKKRQFYYVNSAPELRNDQK